MPLINCVHVWSLPLSFPTHADYNRRFVLDTDASDTGIEAVLSQVKDDGSEVVTAYASRSLSRPERRYCVTRKEFIGSRGICSPLPILLAGMGVYSHN